MRATPTGWEYEPDLRHAEAILEDLGLENEKELTTPGVDDPKKSEDEQSEASTPLGAAESTSFRGIAARGNYVAQDRPDIKFAVKELCRCMSSPTVEDQAKLKRLGRYMKGRPRAVLLHPWQEAVDTIDVYSDANWDGVSPQPEKHIRWSHSARKRMCKDI